MNTRHFTAWLVNDRSCLDQDCMDLTILEDKLTGADPENDDHWSCDSSKERAFYAVTTVSARDGDIEDAIDQAEDLMREAGWRTVGKWDACPNSYIVTVERD